jgi:hypothetical protein
MRKDDRKRIFSQRSKAIIQPLAYEISKKRIEPFISIPPNHTDGKI